MAGSWRVSMGLAAGFLVAIASASANDGRSACWPAPPIRSSSWWQFQQYVHPGGVRVVPLGDGCEPVPPPPALPQTKEPPLQNQPAGLMPPLINSTRSVNGDSGKELCSVGFWNLSGRDVTLTIDGKSFALAKNRKITMQLMHQFSWTADNGPQQIERVPDGQSSFDVVLRE